MSRRDDVLAALKRAGETGVSGESLAARLGVSRTAVAKHVAALRAGGYRIEALPGSGYRLIEVPDLPLPGEVAPLVTDRFWCRFEGGARTASTNDDAKTLARGGAVEGTVVLAARQTAGRGRLGRVWESPEGGAYLSVVLRPPLAPAQLGPLPLVIGLGVACGLESIGCPTRLKWPNDVWLDGASTPQVKLAGVLLEMQAESDFTEWVVAGIGLNVRPPGEIRIDGAAYVTDAVPGTGAAAAAAAVLDGVAAAYREFLIAGFEPLLPEYEARSALIGREVVVRDRDGTVCAEGTVEGVDASGRLVLAGRGGRRAVNAGDVTLAGPG